MLIFSRRYDAFDSRTFWWTKYSRAIVSKFAVRAYLRKSGDAPLMWEEITPQDKNARQAYLNGVDQASIFVLLLGPSELTNPDAAVNLLTSDKGR